MRPSLGRAVVLPREGRGKGYRPSEQASRTPIVLRGDVVLRPPDVVWCQIIYRGGERRGRDETMDTGVSGESRVLAVDGDREGGGELSRLLTGAGYNVRRAADGLSALGEITPTICPDLVLAAVRLPWLRGGGRRGISSNRGRADHSARRCAAGRESGRRRIHPDAGRSQRDARRRGRRDAVAERSEAGRRPATPFHHHGPIHHRVAAVTRDVTVPAMATGFPPHGSIAG